MEQTSRVASKKIGRDTEDNCKTMKKPACATCGRPAKIRRFGKSFCNPHCAAQYEESVDGD